MAAAPGVGVRPWLGLAAFLLLAGAAGLVEKPAPRSLAAIDAGEAAAACSTSGTALPDFWARAQAMGVGAMVLRMQTLRELADSGEVLVFTRPEIAKWKSVGLISANAPLKSTVLWIRDPKLFSRVAESLRGQGLVLSTSSAGGHGLIELVREPDPGLRIGSSSDDLALAVALGLAPLHLDPSGPAWFAGPGPIALRPPRRVSLPAPLPSLLRAIHSQPGRVLLLRLDSADDAETALGAVRAALRPLRQRGLIGTDAAGLQAARRGALPPILRMLAWGLAVLGPIIAVRLGVIGFKHLRVRIREARPIASPGAEIALGSLLAGAAAAAAGLVVGILLAGGDAAALPESLALSTMLWPLVIGGLALYPVSARGLGRGLVRSPTYLDFLKGAALALAAVLLLRPRLLLADTPLWRYLQAAADGSEALWWWPWRWREFLIGLPALMHALYLVGRQAAAEKPAEPDCRLDDPRPWLWLSLFFPIGVIAALGRPEAAPWLVLGQTAVVVAAGFAVGTAVLVAHAYWEAWVLRPGPDRTIDLGTDL
ncbi:MAG: hypothetical protein HY926_04290 [Elusimicrobia bacterium]|nr:hypothetical protein [Elusimicrobiota bacterium]